MADRTVYVDTVNGSASPTDPTNPADAYNTLANAETGEAADLKSTSTILTINCTGSTDDTTQAYFLVWETSAAYYIKIVGDQSTGIFDDSKYFLTVPNQAFGALRIRENYVRVENMQIGGVATAASARFYAGNLSGDSDIRMNKCIIIVAGEASGNNMGLYFSDASTVVTVESTVIYTTGTNDGNYGAWCQNTATFNWCTIYGFAAGSGIRDISATTISNSCVVFKNFDDFNAVDTIQSCASDDGDGTNAVTITQSASDYAALVTDAPNGDFTITDTSSELYNSSVVNTGRPSTDIAGNSWVTNDIGAFAFVSGAPPSTILPIIMNYNQKMRG